MTKHRKAKLDGKICVDCPEPAEFLSTRCAKCNAAQSARGRARRNEMRMRQLKHRRETIKYRTDHLFA